MLPPKVGDGVVIGMLIGRQMAESQS